MALSPSIFSCPCALCGLEHLLSFCKEHPVQEAFLLCLVTPFKDFSCRLQCAENTAIFLLWAEIWVVGFSKIATTFHYKIMFKFFGYKGFTVNHLLWRSAFGFTVIFQERQFSLVSKRCVNCFIISSQLDPQSDMLEYPSILVNHLLQLELSPFYKQQDSITGAQQRFKMLLL